MFAHSYSKAIISQMYYVDEDYPAGSGITEPLSERSNWSGSESSTLENDVYIWCYALI